FVTSLSGSDIAWIDPVLVERFGAGRELREQEMSVVMKIADERRGDAGIAHALFNFGNRRGRFRRIHRHAHHVRSGGAELDALVCGRRRISRVGQRHRLNDDRRTATNLHAAHRYANSTMQLHNCHEFLMIASPPGAPLSSAQRAPKVVLVTTTIYYK